MEIRPRDNDCGAEIDGVDLQSMSDEEVEAIADAQAAYGVVFLRGQTLTPDHAVGGGAAIRPDQRRFVFEQSPAVKVVRNHNGRGWVKNIQIKQ